MAKSDLQGPSQIQAGDHVSTAAGPLPDDLREALTKVNNAGRGAY